MEARNIKRVIAPTKENFFLRASWRAMEFASQTEDVKRCLGRKNILFRRPLCSSFALV